MLSSRARCLHCWAASLFFLQLHCNTCSVCVFSVWVHVLEKRGQYVPFSVICWGIKIYSSSNSCAYLSSFSPMPIFWIISQPVDQFIVKFGRSAEDSETTSFLQMPLLMRKPSQTELADILLSHSQWPPLMVVMIVMMMPAPALLSFLLGAWGMWGQAVEGKIS